MKKVALNLMGLALLAMVFGACNDDNDTPEINLILGEWVAAEGQFLKITVDGEEKSPLDFGMEVLRLNEAEAEIIAKEYIQNTMLGPIDIDEPKIVFLPSEKLTATMSNAQIEGSWKFFNESTSLNLTVPVLNEIPFSYNVKKSTLNELLLDLNWEVSYIGEDVVEHQVIIEINLVK